MKKANVAKASELSNKIDNLTERIKSAETVKSHINENYEVVGQGRIFLVLKYIDIELLKILSISSMQIELKKLEKELEALD